MNQAIRGNDGGGRRLTAAGFTLIEVVIALFIIVISVALALNIMSRLTSYAGREGHTMDIAAAVAVSQNVIDMLRDRPLPPTARISRLDGYDGTARLSADRFGAEYRDYTFTLALERPVTSGGALSAVETGDFDHVGRFDRLNENPHRNLLRVEVNVYRGGVHMMRTVTYKTRDGYY